jgi:ADP-ribosylglycohydrolase
MIIAARPRTVKANTGSRVEGAPALAKDGNGLRAALLRPADLARGQGKSLLSLNTGAGETCSNPAVMTPNKPDAGRFEGCLVGLAIGDALGAQTTGLTRHEIRARWGRVSDFQDSSDVRRAQVASITETVIAIAGSSVRTRGFDPGAASQALREWRSNDRTRLVDRATAEALERIAAGAAPDASGSDSATCYAAARIAPLALLDCRRGRDKLTQDAVAAAVITHRHPRAIAGAVAMATAIADSVTREDDLQATALLSRIAAAAAPHSPEMARAVAGIKELLDLAPRVAMDEIGYSDLAIEAVPAALYCFAATPDDFAESVLLAVNTGGAAAAIAAMVGALGGASLGLAGIPQSWVEGIVASERLQQLARALHAAA